jgi:hypothetical protein
VAARRESGHPGILKMNFNFNKEIVVLPRTSVNRETILMLPACV